ncbi:CFH, partial [Cervus elaphus hippelaphus]
QCTFNYLENGYYTNSHEKYLQGKTVRVRCHDGYSLHNNQNTMTCTEKGWYPPPICVRVGTDCFNLPSFDDAVFIGQKKKSYRSGEEVAFKCRPYYQLNGSNTIQCVKSKWIGRPVCKDVSCVNPPRVENAVIQNDRPRYLNGERVRYECIGTYDILGDVDVTCLNGTWTKPPQCKGECGPPLPTDNGDITSLLTPLYPLRSLVEYQCQAYYELQGNGNSVCQNGEWSEPP